VQEGAERETTDDEGVCKEEGEEGTVGSENDEVVKDRDRDTDRGMDEGVCMGEAGGSD